MHNIPYFSVTDAVTWKLIGYFIDYPKVVTLFHFQDGWSIYRPEDITHEKLWDSCGSFNIVRTVQGWKDGQTCESNGEYG